MILGIMIRKQGEGGKIRHESSFISFRKFIAEMEMGEIKFRGEIFTQENNRENEGFIQERLDRLFGSIDWMFHFDTAEVTHIPRQSSNHSLVVLDTKSHRLKTKSRFIFLFQWGKRQGTKELVKKTWKQPMNRSKMYKAQQKLKLYN